MIKKITINISLMVLSLLMVCLLTEAVLRFTDYRFYLKYESKFPRYYFIEDNSAGHDLNSNFSSTPFNILDTPFNSMKIWTNELSCYNYSYNNESSFILLIGDSFTWGYTNFERTYGNFIENLIKTRVLKCGVPGYGLHQEIIKINKILTKIRKQPKVIILNYFVGNDLMDDYLFPYRTVIKGHLVEAKQIKCESGEIIAYSHKYLLEKVNKYFEDKGIKENIKKYLFSNSIIYNTLRNSVWLRDLLVKIELVEENSCELKFKSLSYALKPSKYMFLEKAWNIHLRNIKLLKKILNNREIKLLVVIIPTKEQVYPFLRPVLEEADWLYTNKVLKEVFARENIQYIDLLPYFQKYADQKPRRFLRSDKDLDSVRLIVSDLKKVPLSP